MSASKLLKIQAGRGELMLVPAVHFSVPFAEAVNAVCCDPQSQPDAVAIELGPETVTALVEWLKELGVGPARHLRLPCMLGFIKRNRMLRPSVRERAMQLQRETGRELSELPPAVLNDELGYRSHSLVLVSPTDSIIEAARCALELGVPVFGVDREDHPGTAARPFVIPDAAAASGNVWSFLDDHNVLTECDADPEMNARREHVMAARLKYLLSARQRVLFTGGLSHWQRLVSRLKDTATPSVDPSIRENAPVNGTLRRVLVSPEIACQGIDRLPVIAGLYERRRRHPMLDVAARPPAPLPIGCIFDAKLRQAIRRYVRANERAGKGPRASTATLEAIGGFPLALATYQRYALREVADVGSTYTCAKAFVGQDFANAVVETFLRFPWACTEDFAELGVLQRTGGDGFEPTVRLVKNGQQGEPFIVSLHGAVNPRNGLAPDDAQDPLTAVGANLHAYAFTWAPWEDLVTANSDMAIRHASSSLKRRIAEPWRASLGSGLAMRETIRAYARGDERLFVYRPHGTSFDARPNPIEGWPVVWIFNEAPHTNCEWHNYLLPLSWLARHAHNRVAFESVFANGARNLSALIGFGRRKRLSGSSGGLKEISCLHLHGLLLFSPVFSSNVQWTRWLELKGNRSAPLYRHCDLRDIPDEVVTRFKRSLKLGFGNLRWQDEIVAMATPFSRSYVTVIAPRRFRLAPEVHRAAKKLGRQIRLLALDNFDAAEVARMRDNISVPGVSNGPEDRTIYDTDAEAQIRESRTRFRDRVPNRWRRFGL
jgi:hypothetical protein